MCFEAASYVLDVMLCMCISTMQFRHAYVIFSRLDHHLSATYGWIPGAFPKSTSSVIAGFFKAVLLNAEHQAGKL